MARKIGLLKLWDGDTLIGLKLNDSTAADSAVPTLEEKELVRIFNKRGQLRKLGTDLMLALEEVAQHYDDKNWPDDMGYSKRDLEKQVVRFEQALKGQ